MTVHKPVLTEEVIEGLSLKNGSVAVDATLGGGGHSLKILEKILPGGKLVAIDRDQEAIERFRKKAEGLKIKLKEENFDLVHGNFSDLEEILAKLKIQKVDAILADLGISSDQLEGKMRGFSFQQDGALDMRMDQAKGKTAAEVVNGYSQEELIRVLEGYGEEKNARRIAKAIIVKRSRGPIERTAELVEIIDSVTADKYKHSRIHFATKTFQALRMEVNQELESLKKFLDSAIGALAPGGRLAVIAFHSGEDAIVKSIFRDDARGCICPPNFPVCRCGKVPIIKIINTKPIVAGKAEVEENPRSRSAKLRIIEKI